MSATRVLPRPGRSLAAIAVNLLLAQTAAAAALLIGVGAFAVGVRLVYLGRALPGVSAAGLSLGGRSQGEIEAALAQALTYPETGLIALQDGGRLWAARPIELGVWVDVSAMARQALSIGRRGNLLERFEEQFDAWTQGVAVSPVVVFDQRLGATYLERLAQQIDQPVIEATLSVRGLEVEMRQGQIGRRLDVPATLAALAPVVTRLYDAQVPLVIDESPPVVLDASQQAALAREMLSQPLVLTAEGTGPWAIQPAALAEMLRFNVASDNAGSNYQLGVDAEQMRQFLEPLAPTLERQPENARFIFNDETRQLDLLRPAVIGRTLDIPTTIEAVNDGLNAGQHQLGLVFQTTDPAVGSDATAAELGISENVVAVSTYFAGSSPARMNNIATAAGAFHGLLVAPGETLSMADVLGEISLDTGYQEALIIYGDRTINGVGGGVCQVSTTLFRAVFFAGYQIDERHPHAYRVSYYEQRCNLGTTCAGFDATVFAPLVDFRFTNDSPNWLLMETYIYGTQLLWKFYSTSDGRQVQWTTTGLRNVVEAPEPLYRENPDLERGEIKQVDYQADGADITVTRTVTRGGEVIHQDTFRTRYLPWRAIYEYGPGTELPPGAKTE
ncbi:MAG: VanW family protein [Chloroflexota bacterium]